ncbi:MAG TPA: substrate-binding domain-containing protein, partial [Saprospiraceae bacterium]|nr:substrate-binding domain-containing protein [Saprospiraceae bacterium]
MTGLRIQTGVVICLLSLSHWLLSCSAPGEKSLTIAAAANLQPVMDRIINRFDSIYGIKSQLILNASGKITAQILHGAPYDVFLSADMNFPQ